MCWLAPLALLLDLLFPDPRALPHPVQGIALLADSLEAPARRLPWKVFSGGVALCFILVVVLGLAWLFVSLPSIFGTLAAVYLGWSGLALGGLLREGNAALAAVTAAEKMKQLGDQKAEAQALDKARRMVQMLVSRDTSCMDTHDLYRSLAESVSENFNDAFVAPYFWLCLGGPAALWFYKAASTMDSLWGYKTEAWRELGKASARLDDILAFIPARLSVILMLLTARLQNVWRNIGGRHSQSGRSLPVTSWSWSALASQARNCDSPNAGWPMAAAAWILNGRCGGPTPYAGEIIAKHVLGPEDGEWTAHNVRLLMRLVGRAGILGGILASLLLFAVA